jgi:hypothetical protein|tara:strand:- start:401 stop:565 length:165 start_codon:yes stop_codon:yes gene_type:complete
MTEETHEGSLGTDRIPPSGTDLNDKDKSDEAKKKEEELKKRIEELRKRDPFIYK